MSGLSTPTVAPQISPGIDQPKHSFAEALRCAASWVIALLAVLWLLFLHPKAGLLESALVIAAGCLGFLRPAFGSRWFRGFERGIARLARHRTASLILVILLAMGGRALLLLRFPVPTPRIHDEFSYLLAGETFAAGRLTNPTHPMWMHFETFQVDQKPTYMSMYPPAQGFLLALGDKLGGLPWLGIWLSSAMMCGAICWALQGWLPPRWALFGGILAILRLGLFSYFVNSYWGGAVSATGGALVIGAFPRVLKTGRSRDAVLMGLGLALLANSRPFEGFLLGAAAVSALVFYLFRRPLRRHLWRVVIPILLVICAAGAGTAYYNARVFGSPLTLPYWVNRATYAVVPVFLWQHLAAEPVYNHKALRDYFLGWELTEYKEAHSAGIWLQVNTKAFLAWFFYFGPPLTSALLAFPFLLGDRRLRPIWFITAAVAAGEALEIFFKPHYVAPLTAAILVLIVEGLRRVECWRWRMKRAGRFLVRCTIPICIAASLCVAAKPGLWTESWLNYPWYYFIPSQTPRDQMIERLRQLPGRHLIVVRYGPHHEPFREWIYNAADIDGSKIVWARDMGTARNRELLDYFHDRRAWLLQPDELAPHLQPYAGQPR